MRKLTTLFSIAVSLLIVGSAMAVQTENVTVKAGKLSGKVMDMSGDAVKNVSLKVRNEKNEVIIASTTSKTGEYSDEREADAFNSVRDLPDFVDSASFSSVNFRSLRSRLNSFDTNFWLDTFPVFNR